MWPPNKIGVVGRAWRIPPPEVPDAHLARYLLDTRAGHPAIGQYIVAMIHLRVLNPANPPKLAAPEVTHAIVVVSLDPEQPVRADTPGPFHVVTVEVENQFRAEGDDEALRILERVVDELCAGTMNPDEKFRQLWPRFLGGVIGNLRREERVFVSDRASFHLRKVTAVTPVVEITDLQPPHDLYGRTSIFHRKVLSGIGETVEVYVREGIEPDALHLPWILDVDRGGDGVVFARVPDDALPSA